MADGPDEPGTAASASELRRLTAGGRWKLGGRPRRNGSEYGQKERTGLCTKRTRLCTKRNRTTASRRLSRRTSAKRLERLIEVAGLSREEFAERLGFEYDRVAEWFEGAELTGGEVWHVARFAWSIPGGMEIIMPEAGEGAE